MEMSGGPTGPGAPPAGGVPPAPQQAPYPGGQPPYAAGPGPYGGAEQQGGFADDAARFARRHIRTPETKEFFKTSEFFVWILTVIGVLIAASSIGGGASDYFRSAQAWTLIVILSVGYMLSRGLSKTGARRSRLDD